MARVAVFSAGSWGTAMAKVFADAGNNVMAHARRDEVVDAINTRHQPPPLCFSWSCNGAAGLRARYGCVPSVDRMTWGVVSPGLGGAVGDADERPGHRPVRCNAGQFAGGRSA
ncbi:hypothetical protein ACFRDV_38815 [Streptomyces fagopyri]|uniref:hypothetical protein n=1 Tax=Streptomyces fagopyri TaxID=2662397 RepID=UPI0036D1D7C2